MKTDPPIHTAGLESAAGLPSDSTSVSSSPSVPQVAPLHIGSLQLTAPILQAPIAGFTDLVFRRIVRELGGCGLMYTEMVSAGGWVRGNIPPERLVGVASEPGPLGVQLWDREPEMVEEAARRLVDLGISVIDLNFGCPKKRIMGKQGSGAQLLRDPATIARMIEATIRGAGEIPVTAKIRLGPNSEEITSLDVARAVESAGAAALTVHGRTAKDGYGIPVNHLRIAEVVDAVSIPVIANGDVVDAASALKTLENTGAAGVMVARRCLSAPWVFREIEAALNGAPIPPQPTLIEQREQLLRHHGQLVEMHGDPFGTILMRKFAARYLTGVRGAKSFRAEVTVARNSEDFRRIVEQLFPVADDTELDGNRGAKTAAEDLVEPECQQDGSESHR
ncbi:MAG: tRNA dihydrouridine synthase DusB [Planctomycetota bacterium]|nr:tRNA dihydrouridine synthase DusB [Planctomycetota bacterium]